MTKYEDMTSEFGNWLAELLKYCELKVSNEALTNDLGRIKTEKAEKGRCLSAQPERSTRRLQREMKARDRRMSKCEIFRHPGEI